MTETRILITGATGYIGGSILTDLLRTNHRAKDYVISALVRRADQAKALESKGVNPILFKDLDDSETITRAASEHDIVINTASGFHTSSARALILGLSSRQKQTGSQTHFIHTSGTSNLADRPLTRSYTESRIFTDKSDIYAYEKHREELEVYAQRTTDLAVTDTGLAHGVKTYIIMSPTIYGVGTGLFNTLSIQIPTLMRDANISGSAAVLGNGREYWDHVHIADLVGLYGVLLGKIVEGETIPSGKAGIYFSGTGEHTWLQVSEGIAKAGVELGVLESEGVREIGIAEAAGRWTGGNERVVELAYASRARTRAVLGRELGWKPVKTDGDFEESFLTEFRVVLEEGK
ncbi:NAD dependent epimerase/dehydratase family protein [Dendryphion nanum]|uniref:NAD dependent epimerase/dehydratase family protein n=1 Tax=Dendryphion nanum TaxID=256645 RepID=A0A9P9DF33_9PLEO|nr:NAD dependent epimerase/dehydratase family protein [Dendryphion nanum]